MKKIAFAAVAAFVACGIIGAQEPPSPAVHLPRVLAGFGAQDDMGGKQDPPQMPKPGKEHELLKQFEGTFECVAKFWMEPGQPPTESKGTETARVTLGGFWLTYEYKGEMMGGAFEGQGTMGYDIAKKKFVGTWIDNMMPMLFVAEGEVDKSGKVFTMKVEGVDPQTGKPVKEKWISEIRDKDTKLMTFLREGADGKDVKTGEITYTRKKK